MEDMHMAAAKENVLKAGYLDIETDPTLDLFHEIERLKKEKNAIILALIIPPRWKSLLKSQPTYVCIC
jgi:hypothetical protein